MTNIRLLSLDLDGTLLNSQKQISDENLEALLMAKANGVKIVLNTGRPLISTLEYLSTLNLYGQNEYCITYNGGLVQENEGTILSKQILNREEVLRVIKEAEAADLPCDIISNDICYTLEFGRKSQLCYINNTLEFQNISLEQLPEEAEFNKIILSADPELLDEFQKGLPVGFADSYELFRTRDILLEIMPKGVNKARGLELLCKHLNISASEVLAMGDEDNDAPMLKWAGLGIAPANSKRVAREAADQVSAFSNDEDAIAQAIKDYVL